MGTNSIEIRSVGKRYCQYPSRKARLKEWLFPFLGKRHTENWVLQDVNLDVRQGEAVGIVGMNGAGKSTLLKIITGTTQPTCGTVKLNGKATALLELGLGFHPDFTGRQNVYMSGQLMGYSNEEIDECMKEVEEFAEIGDAIDAPVRTYSSGMQVRLAFSVATMKRPDILIVDEALSVGDAYFQHKSFKRIRKFNDEGTTLLLVSHDKGSIQAVCDRAILLKEGSIIKEGSPENVMGYYNALLGEKDKTRILEKKVNEESYMIKSGTGEAVVTSIKIVAADTNKPLSIIDIGTSVKLIIQVEIISDIPELVVGMNIKDRYGQEAYGYSTFYADKILYDLKRGQKIEFVYSFNLDLGIGKYSITTALVLGADHLKRCYEWKDLAYMFEVVSLTNKNVFGVAWLNAELDIRQLT